MSAAITSARSLRPGGAENEVSPGHLTPRERLIQQVPWAANLPGPSAPPPPVIVKPQGGGIITTTAGPALPSAPPPVVIVDPIKPQLSVPGPVLPSPAAPPVIADPRRDDVSLIIPNASPQSALARPISFLSNAQPIPGINVGGAVGAGVPSPGGGWLGGISTILDVGGKIVDIFRGAGKAPAAGPGSSPAAGGYGTGDLAGLNAPIFNQSGLVGGVATVVKAAAKSKWIRTVVGGAISWVLVDLATGAIKRIQSHKPSRRMNVLNPRALGRANRRMCGFRDVASKALRHYGYHVSRSVSPRSCKTKKRCKR